MQMLQMRALVTYTPPVTRLALSRRCLLALLLTVAWSTSLVSLAHGATLPDGRAYELVTRYEEGGREVGLDGAEIGIGVPSVNGDAFDWESLSGCCGATTGSLELYQSDRGPDGWQTKAITPNPGEALGGGDLLEGILEEQVPVFWSPDLSSTIFLTPAAYSAGDHRPAKSRVNELYSAGPDGSLTWLSQGPSGSGDSVHSVTFDGATPNAKDVVFSTQEQLTPNAIGMETNEEQQYLYVRDVETGSTRLVNVNNSGSVLGLYGAVFGDGSAFNEGYLPVNRNGTTTNAISEDGSKIFFATPSEAGGNETAEAPSHLYMRDLSNETTTSLDDPSSSGSARYEGAAQNGSLAFFSSDEGLDGASSAKELYEFNATDEEIGSAAPMSAIPISSGEYVGISAVSNDGTRVFFIDDSVLAPNTNPVGRAAVEGEPNMYAYDTRTGQTTFIATVPLGDVSECNNVCATSEPGGLVYEPDIDRPVYPTPDGSVLTFETTGNITGKNHYPETVLTAATAEGHGEDERTLDVASTAGFHAGQAVEVGSGEDEQVEEIETIDSPTEMTLTWTQQFLSFKPHAAGEAVVQPTFQVYRYSTAENSLLCISCAPAGAVSSDATVGLSGGGSYAPQGETVPMSEDGSRIFFEASAPLLAGVQASSTGGLEPRNVYEWEHGKLSLISDGSASEFIFYGTTPSGNDTFFRTRAQMTSTETGGAETIYDARVGGGFPEPAPPVPCTAEDCRAPAAATEFSIPASATLKGPLPSTTEPSLTAPHLLVASITAAERDALARTGHITLEVTVTAPGKVAGQALAKLNGKMQRVARASVTLEHPGTAALKLSLSRAAMQALAKSGSLSLQLQISYSASGTVEQAKLKLTSDSHAAGARR